ncbi:hypothetical protein SAMN05421858_3510 [Haladaptatus litoreus]|uniref:Uncharacterized protein n=1 Tax=Haladaptatus litoreus TaxID=553468 RepID=A0A1N7DCL2_9EURY|nr:hypothetical protein SAMN05421858_3510 [Haladaptatus litoreus]
MENMSNYHSLFEMIILKAVSFTITLLIIVLVTIYLISKGRFADAKNWLISDWREPL